MALLLCLAAGITWGQSNFCGLKNRVVKSGEVVNFTVYYNLSAVWVGAAKASFTTKLETLDGKPVFHVIGLGNTVKSYDWIFSVKDKYETYIDTATMLPVKFVRDINEDGHKLYQYVRFLPAQKKAFTNNKVYTVPECIQDVLSAVYYARNIDYSKYNVGDKIPFDMFLDEEVFHLYIRYMGKEKITTKYGTFNTIKIKPLLVEGTLFKGGEKMEIYVSDDDNHIPVRISSPILVGSIKVDMMSYSGIRYPLSSLVKKK
ncbi:DUF3108 domain-containing protein [Taibaiella sp. KBW10]|nr:DUF3108 domain-containing protein [Taibaiella sp. KBW10]